jgi:hypothetical protein
MWSRFRQHRQVRSEGAKVVEQLKDVLLLSQSDRMSFIYTIAPEYRRDILPITSVPTKGMKVVTHEVFDDKQPYLWCELAQLWN